MLLEALAKLPDTLEMRKKVVESILAHSDRSSGTIRFTEQQDSALFSILSSPIRDNAAILMAFLSHQAAGASEDPGDITLKLMATIASSRRGQAAFCITQQPRASPRWCVRSFATARISMPETVLDAQHCLLWERIGIVTRM
jgi:hypothetical protein